MRNLNTMKANWTRLLANVPGSQHFMLATDHGGQKQRGAISQAELQQDVQRFTGAFEDRIVQAAAPLTNFLRSPDARSTAEPDLTEQALRRVLVYQASALNIATGHLPELNLLDMLVFVTLIRQSFEQYWLPEVFGERGRPMLQTLTSCEHDAWLLASKFMGPQQVRELHERIDAWRAENPDQIRVESVRLADFSKMAGKAARGRDAGGLLASVKSATKTADEARLLGERALFLAQRSPFLVRLHARVGACEIMGDSKRSLAQGEALMARAEALVLDVKELRPLVQETTELVGSLRALAKEAGQLAQALEPLKADLVPLLALRAEQGKESVTGLERLVSQGQRLSETVQLTLHEASALAPSEPAIVQRLLHVMERTVRRWLLYLAVLGAFVSLVFWGAYYVVRSAP